MACSSEDATVEEFSDNVLDCLLEYCTLFLNPFLLSIANSVGTVSYFRANSVKEDPTNSHSSRVERNTEKVCKNVGWIEEMNGIFEVERVC